MPTHCPDRWVGDMCCACNLQGQSSLLAALIRA